MKKRTQAELEAENKSLSAQLKHYTDLFKQRQARPILLPNDMTPTEFNWLCQILAVQREKLTAPLLTIPQTVEQKIILDA